MAHYDDVVVPNSVRFGSGTLPRTSTAQLFLDSGFRKASRRWDQKLHRLRLTHKLTIQAAYDLAKIWQAIDGPAHSFLARDWNDWNTTAGRFKVGDESLVTALDQPLQNTATGLFTGDGSTTTFQAIIRYSEGATASHIRTIKKLQSDTVVTAVDGSPVVPDSIDTATGIVTFSAAPGDGLDVTWGGAFYVPVAFRSDDGFEQLMRNFEITVSEFELLEVRL